MSVIVYRLSPFHPLAGYPGPAVGKITRFWALYIAQSGNQHRYHRALFEQYGDTVRTGWYPASCDPFIILKLVV